MYTGFYHEDQIVTLTSLGQSGRLNRMWIRPDGSIVAQVAYVRQEASRDPTSSIESIRSAQNVRPPSYTERDNDVPDSNTEYGQPGSIIWIKNQDSLTSIGLVEKVKKETKRAINRISPY